MKTADVVAKNDVAEWVTDAIVEEFQHAGYQVTRGSSSKESTSGLVVSGEVLTVYCTALFSYEGDVSFTAIVMKDGKELIRKRYTGQGGAGVNWAATSSSYGYSLSEALERAAKDLLRDLRAYNN